MIDGVLCFFFSQQSKVTYQVALWVREPCFAWLRATPRKWVLEVVKEFAIEFASCRSFEARRPHSLRRVILASGDAWCVALWQLSETPQCGSERWKPLQLITKMQRWCLHVAASFKLMLLLDKLRKNGCSIAKPPLQSLLKMYDCKMNAGPEHSDPPKAYIVFYGGSRLLHPDVLNTAKFKPRRSKIKYEPQWWGQHRNYIIIPYRYLYKKCIISALTGCVFLHGS